MLDSVRIQYRSGSRMGKTQHLTDLKVDGKRWLSSATLAEMDRAADRRLDGGFKGVPCPSCFELRSVNGSCGC